MTGPPPRFTGTPDELEAAVHAWIGAGCALFGATQVLQVLTGLVRPVSWPANLDPSTFADLVVWAALEDVNAE